MAFWAESASMVTKPNPRERPVSRSAGDVAWGRAGMGVVDHLVLTAGGGWCDRFAEREWSNASSPLVGVGQQTHRWG